MIITVLVSIKPTGLFKIPNREVMMDWARRITDGVESHTDILNVCVEGHITAFEEKVAKVQQHLDPDAVIKVRGAVSPKTLERSYHVYFLGLMHVIRPKGWKVFVERRAGGGCIDIHPISREKHSAVLIELKSSEKLEHMESDAQEALQQIIDKNYRNQEGFRNIHTLRIQHC